MRPSALLSSLPSIFCSSESSRRFSSSLMSETGATEGWSRARVASISLIFFSIMSSMVAWDMVGFVLDATVGLERDALLGRDAADAKESKGLFNEDERLCVSTG